MKIYGGLGILLSFTIGAGITSYGMANYDTPAPTTQHVRTVGEDITESPTPTPSEMITPPGVEVTPSPTVEGDDGSMGGPVLDETHQAEPTYIINTSTPAPTSEDASEDTAEPEVIPSRTASATAPPRPAAPSFSPPPVAEGPILEENPSDDPEAG